MNENNGNASVNSGAEKAQALQVLSALNFNAYHRVLALSGKEIISKLADLAELGLERRGEDVFLQREGATEPAPFNPLKNDSDSFWLMDACCVLKELDEEGKNYYVNDAKNPIRFWQRCDESSPGGVGTNPIHLAICRAALLGMHPEFTAHLNG